MAAAAEFPRQALRAVPLGGRFALSGEEGDKRILGSVNLESGASYMESAMQALHRMGQL